MPVSEKSVSTEQALLFKAMRETVLTETNGFRERRLYLWRILDYYWYGKQFLDRGGNISVEGQASVGSEEEEDERSRKVINIYRARGESLISALSNQFPNVFFYPTDANDAESVSAAMAKNKLARRIVNQNNPELFLAKAFYILFEQDFLACWNRVDQDVKYGMDTVLDKKRAKICPECDEKTKNGYCEGCNKTYFKTGEKQQPRARQELMLYGPRNVTIPSNSQEVKKIPYVLLRELVPTSWLKWKYSDQAEEIKDDTTSNDTNSALYSYTTDGEERVGTTVLSNLWIKPWALYSLNREFTDSVKDFVKKYPNGVRVVMSGDTVLEVIEEDLQDVWTFTESPTSKTIHDDPIGKILIDTQDLLNETYNLTVDTIAQGVPDLYADPLVLDPESYAKRRAAPGSYVPTKPVDGTKRLSDYFYSPTPTRLSEEVTHFNTRLEGASQELSGATPAIYGGQLKGSRTASEYAMSREQALERLNVKYRMAKDFISKVLPRAVAEYAKHMATEKETYVEKDGDNFRNDDLEREDLLGQTGRVEVEGGAHVPMSWSQIKQSITDMIHQGSPLIQRILEHPQNTLLIKQVIGVQDLFVPGENSRNKQQHEIGLLKEGAPVLDEANPQQQVPSVRTVPGVDMDMVELEVCRVWLTSEEGLHYKETKPDAYINVQLHAQEHSTNLQAQQQQEQQAPASSQEQGVLNG